MPRESRITYNPKLSVAENAKRNGVTEYAIRYYIRTRGIDRRYEEKKKVLKGIKAYLKEHPNATRAEIAKETGHGINTVRRYWDILHGEGKLQPSEKKADVREQRVTAINNRHIACLDKLPIEFIKEYLEQREAANNIPIEMSAEVMEQTPKKARAKTKQPKALRANSTILCTDEFVYFYQNTPLSNWWASNPRIPYDGHDFASSEALYMYLKAKGLGDSKVANEILALDDNAKLTDRQRFVKAKSLGKKCKFNKFVFFANREQWMYTALSAKFEVDEEFRSVLMSEEYRGLTFVEASPRDVNWGIGLSVSAAYEGKAWKGKNLLGKLLTQLRDANLK